MGKKIILMLLAGGLTLLSASSNAANWWGQQSGSTEAVKYKLNPPKDITPVIEGDIVYFKGGGNEAGLEINLDCKPAAGKRIDLRFSPRHLPWNRIVFTISDDENIRIEPGKNGINYRRWKNNKAVVEYGGFSVHETFNRSFNWPESVFKAVDLYNNRYVRKIEDTGLDLSLTFSQDSVNIEANGFMLDKVPLEKSFFEKNLSFTISKEQKFLGAVISNQPDPLFHPVNISARTNAAGIGNEKINRDSLPPHGTSVTVDGIPFVFPAPEPVKGYDNVDIGQSYFPQGSYSGWGAAQQDFGGRWAEGSKGNPSRIRFRVPYDQYNAIYVLAAADESGNSISNFTVQFYRPKGGYPKNFRSPDVPLFSRKGESVKSFPVKTESGKERYLHLVRIPVDSAQIEEFNDLSYLDFELAKDVKVYRSYPDPFYGSWHGGGLPSAVRIFAMTMAVAPVKITLEQDIPGNIWHESEKVSCTPRLRNMTGSPRKLTVSLKAESYDGKDIFADSKELELKSSEEKEVKFEFMPKRFGHYDAVVVVKDGGSEIKYPRTVSYLRKREYSQRDFHSKGFMFGFWPWRGGHNTPSTEMELEIAGRLGLETMSSSIDTSKFSPQSLEIMKKYFIRGYAMGCTGGIKTANAAKGEKQEDATAKSLEEIEKNTFAASERQDPQYAAVFIEPGGIGTQGTLGEFYNEKNVMTEKEQARFESVKWQLPVCADKYKSLKSGVSVLLPWGDPVYPVPFLKLNDEKITGNVDGMAFDSPLFARTPESQMGQNNTLHRMWQFTETWKKYKKKAPVLITIEGPFVSPVCDAYLTEREYAANLVRSCLILGAYGINRQYSAVAIADCADWWGEEQYGANGLLGRKNSYNPHVACSTFGTLVRHLRNMEFDGWEPTGSLSVYCLRFKDIKTGGLLRVMWTIRGKRETEISGIPGKVEIFDPMDNSTQPEISGGKLSVTLDDMPIYLYGLGEKSVIALGKADHSDSILSANSVKIANAADIFRPQKDDDSDYLDSFPAVVRRFYAEMEISKSNAPSEYGGKALMVDLKQQPIDRLTMPYYTTLFADGRKILPGKPSHISVWVKGNSDWGRMVFVLRDAKGEKWISTGSKNEYNSDDQFTRSFFNFDGWRLMKLELPGTAPYDCFREVGTTWWGSSGGDGIVDYPLHIEKMFVERRLKAMYVNSLESVPNNKPIEIADIYAEYASKSDMTEQAVEISKIRMSLPEKEMSNPIDELKKTAKLPSVKILDVKHPNIQQIDGTRGNFFFETVPDVSKYEIYLSFYPDGRGGMKMATLKESGQMVSGFVANKDTYAFLVYYDKKGQQSAPSEAFKFKLEDLFSQK